MQIRCKRYAISGEILWNSSTIYLSTYRKLIIDILYVVKNLIEVCYKKVNIP